MEPETVVLEPIPLGAFAPIADDNWEESESSDSDLDLDNDGTDNLRLSSAVVTSTSTTPYSVAETSEPLFQVLPVNHEL
jgi:hypothetical protein